MFIIVAKIVGKAGKEGELESMLRDLIAPTRAEEGCVQYDLQRSLEHRNVFLFYERWRTQPDWDRHMETPYLQRFLAESPALVDDLELLQMEPVDAGD